MRPELYRKWLYAWVGFICVAIALYFVVRELPANSFDTLLYFASLLMLGVAGFSAIPFVIFLLIGYLNWRDRRRAQRVPRTG
jgi:hypothetical protein